MRHFFHTPCIILAPCMFGVALAMTAAMTSHAPAQETQAADQPAFAEGPPAERPGLLNELGKLLKGPADLLPSLTKPEADRAAPSPVPSAPPPPPPQPTASAPPVSAPPVAEPPAATASTRLFPGMATGREVCPKSANGAPDCEAGADKLCRDKGYKGGKSLNTDSAFGCSSRQARAAGGKACGTEHFVTSAFCN